MRTLVVSDLHLGAPAGVDVLRHAGPREPLLEALEDADRLVLLGDVLELRGGPTRLALERSREFFEALGARLAGVEVVLVPGNHDWALIAPWLERHAQDGGARLGLERRLAPSEASPAAAAIAAWLEPASLSVAYPGVWLRDDVYATHGHYLDCHLTVPTFERLAIGATARIVARSAATAHSAEDYEALVAPVYSWIDAVAQRSSDRASGVAAGVSSALLWRGLSRRGRGRRSIRGRLLRGAFPLAIRALNRIGLGPLHPGLSHDELRLAGLRGMGEVVARLGIEAGHVIFGHTHRSGPLPADAPGEWRAATGPRLINSGCWVFETHLMRRVSSESPYWPGVCVSVGDAGAPALERLLSERSRGELAPAAH